MRWSKAKTRMTCDQQMPNRRHCEEDPKDPVENIIDLRSTAKCQLAR